MPKLSHGMVFIFKWAKITLFYLGISMGNLWVLLSIPIPIPIPTTHGLSGYGLPAITHHVTAPASQETCNCRLLQVQELMMTMTLHVVIVRAG
jgi:hypothetical protein